MFKFISKMIFYTVATIGFLIGLNAMLAIDYSVFNGMTPCEIIWVVCTAVAG